jgi:hypothetical protein
VTPVRILSLELLEERTVLSADLAAVLAFGVPSLADHRPPPGPAQFRILPAPEYSAPAQQSPDTPTNDLPWLSMQLGDTTPTQFRNVDSPASPVTPALAPTMSNDLTRDPVHPPFQEPAALSTLPHVRAEEDVFGLLGGITGIDSLDVASDRSLVGLFPDASPVSPTPAPQQPDSADEATQDSASAARDDFFASGDVRGVGFPAVLLGLPGGDRVEGGLAIDPPAVLVLTPLTRQLFDQLRQDMLAAARKVLTDAQYREFARALLGREMAEDPVAPNEPGPEDSRPLPQ